MKHWIFVFLLFRLALLLTDIKITQKRESNSVKIAFGSCFDVRKDNDILFKAELVLVVII